MGYHKSAAFIDLQGTLGGTGLDDISTFEFYPFSAAAIRELNCNGLLAVIITNQSHIAGGRITQEDFDRKMDALKRELTDKGAFLDGVYCCPHGRNDQCVCKKPLPGLVEKAATELGVDLNRSYVIGDMGMNDIVLARNVGAKGILVLTGVGKGSLNEFRDTWSGYEADHVADNILDAVQWILQQAG